jgi:hypothetical protein
LQTLRAKVYPFGPPTQDSLTSSPTPFPPLTSPPTVHTREPQNPEMITSNSAISVRGSITPSLISEDYARTLRASEVMHSCPSSRSSPTSSTRKAAPLDRTLDDGSGLSGDVSTITLPSFVEQEQPNTSPAPILPPPIHFSITEGAFPSLTRFSFQPSRPRSAVANTTAPTTPSSDMHLRHDLLSPSMFAHDRPPSFRWTRSLASPRRASVRRELATAKLKYATQAEAVRIVQPGSLETSERPRTSGLRGDALSPLTIPTRTLSFLGDYDAFPYSHREEPGTSPASNDSPRPISPMPSPQDGAPPALYMNDPIEPSSLYQSPVLGLSNSPGSYTSLDGKRSRGTSQATSSMSTVPSISAFPSPPDFTPGCRDKVLSTLSNYSTSGQPFLLAMLRERASVGGAETKSLNKGRASTPLPAVDVPRLMTTVNSYSVLSRHLHSELMGRDDMSTRLVVSSSMKRLSRVPLGPRKMCGGPKSSLFWTSHPPSL